MLEPGYAYVRLRVFQERTSDELKRVLEELHDEAAGGLEGLVLDLRDNPGGLLDPAVEVADTWLAEGLVVYTQGRGEGRRKEFRAHADGTEPRYPIAVLVNEGTASSSEIVAGALQDQYRALVIGVTTFGKGSVQIVYPLEGGTGLRLTTAHYYTPSGRSIQEVGITPDIAVDSVRASEASAAPTLPLGRDLESGEPEESAAPQAATQSRDSAPALEEESDVQLDRALEVLKSGTLFERFTQGPAARDRAALPGGLGVVGLDTVRLDLPRDVRVARLGVPLLLHAGCAEDSRSRRGSLPDRIRRTHLHFALHAANETDCHHPPNSPCQRAARKRRALSARGPRLVRVDRAETSFG
jgi:hypothetical protein